MDVCFCYVCFSLSALSQEIGWEERLQNDLFSVGWDENLNAINSWYFAKLHLQFWNSSL